MSRPCSWCTRVSNSFPRCVHSPRELARIALPLATFLGLALAHLFTPLRASAAPAATDTVFAWTVDPYTPDPAYLARNYGCGVFDTRRGRAMVLAGGETVSFPGGSQYAQSATTVTRGAGEAAWTALDASAPVAARLDEACAVYDSVGDAVWLFGGRHYTNSTISSYGWTTQVLDGLWRFGVASPAWTPVAPIGPAPGARVGASLVLDPVRRRVWLFGGEDSLGVALGDLWSMDLAAPGAWTHVVPAGSAPAPRARHLAVYDPGADRMLVTAGRSGTTDLSDTWALSLQGTPSWQPLGAGGPAPAGRLVGAYDAVRGRLLAGGNGDGLIHVLDAASNTWEQHVINGTGRIDVGSALILDAGNNELVSAWSGYASVAGGISFTPPTAFLHFGVLQPIVHLTASFLAAHYLRGSAELDWDIGYDHPLWGPATLEFTSLAGVTTSQASIAPAAPGPVAVGLVNTVLAGDSVAMHVAWFDGAQRQVTADVPIRFPPPPLVLHVTPDSLWQAGSDLHVWFRVPDDSAQYLADQVLERSVDGGPWQFRQRGFPGADSIWAFNEPGIVTFTTYGYRLTWTGPDGATRASAPMGTTILGPPVFLDDAVTADSVRIRWSTKAGVDELGRVLVQRPASPAWSDTIPLRTDADGVMTMRDTLVVAASPYSYRLEWFNGQQWSVAQDIALNTPGGPDTTHVGAALWLGAARPNPARLTDGFDLPLSATGSGGTRIDVFDVLGRRRWSGTAAAGATAFHVPTSGLGSGVYLVRAVHGGVVRSARVAILR